MMMQLPRSLPIISKAWTSFLLPLVHVRHMAHVRHQNANPQHAPLIRQLCWLAADYYQDPKHRRDCPADAAGGRLALSQWPPADKAVARFRATGNETRSICGQILDFGSRSFFSGSAKAGPLGGVGSSRPIRSRGRRTAQQGRQSGCIRPRKPGQLGVVLDWVDSTLAARRGECVPCLCQRPTGGRWGASRVHLIRHRIEFAREAAPHPGAGAQHAHHWWLLPSSHTHSHVGRSGDEDDGHLVDVKVSCARARAAAAAAAATAAEPADREHHVATRHHCRRRHHQCDSPSLCFTPTPTATSFAPKDHRHAAVIPAVAKTIPLAGRSR